MIIVEQRHHHINSSIFCGFTPHPFCEALRSFGVAPSAFGSLTNLGLAPGEEPGTAGLFAAQHSQGHTWLSWALGCLVDIPMYKPYVTKGNWGYVMSTYVIYCNMVITFYIILRHVIAHLIYLNICCSHPKCQKLKDKNDTWNGVPQQKCSTISISGESLGQQCKVQTQSKNEVGYSMDFNGIYIYIHMCKCVCVSIAYALILVARQKMLGVQRPCKSISASFGLGQQTWSNTILDSLLQFWQFFIVHGGVTLWKLKSGNGYSPIHRCLSSSLSI